MCVGKKHVMEMLPYDPFEKKGHIWVHESRNIMG